ncbi:MAG: ABC transporter permease [Armatimonadetes bacterium]|nr:ABC transporter permease [Armatimonadota bacterium]
MLGVLLALCAVLSLLTVAEQYPNGREAVRDLGPRLGDLAAASYVLVVARDNADDREFVSGIQEALQRTRARQVFLAVGEPSDARRTIERMVDAGTPPELLVCNHFTAEWPLLRDLAGISAKLANTRVVQPRPHRWPVFLKRDNLLNIANQIVVIATIAIGMTLVIITGGIDLSVGSLIALSAVVASVLIRRWGGEQAGPAALIAGSLGGIAACAVIGLFNGLTVTALGIPPFIVTLGMMLVASGLAFILCAGQSVYQVPAAYTWLGRGATAGIPNAVGLMLLLYGIAHLVMTRTVFGRQLYAAGGNRDAARLSGVRVNRLLVAVYTICGALAGLGGVITASQLKSGSPTYGQMYELYVIAAVVVGGASLSGGQGKVLGTLIGACIIAVIQNGMNLRGVEPYTQKVVLGLVILGAVFLDTLKKRKP